MMIAIEFLQQNATPEAQGLPTPQLVLALTVAFSMVVIVAELVRRQKLREEYAFLWMGTAVVLMALALNTGILIWLSTLVRAESLVSILFFGAHVFLMLMALQFSVRLTKLTFRSNSLTQKVALLEQQIEELNRRVGVAQSTADDADGIEVIVPRAPQPPERAPSEPRRDPVR